MEGTTPGIIPKTALVGSRLIYRPFQLPQKLNDSMTAIGAASNKAVAGVATSLGEAVGSLQPKGPAKWLMSAFTKTLEATQKSEAIGARNKAVFWDPFSQGMEQVGRALAGPGAYYYLRKSGVENPTQDAIKGVLQLPMFSFPKGEEVMAFEAKVAEIAATGAAAVAAA